MAYAKKTKKRRATQKGKPRKRRSTGRRRGVHGVATVKANTTNQILDLLKKGGLMMIGFLGGREISRKLVTDAEGVKKFIGPIVQAGGGYVLARMKNENLRYIGYGLVGGGIIEGAGKVFGKDFVANGFLNGLHGLSDLRELISGPSEPGLPMLPTFDNQGLAPIQEVIETPHVVIQ